MPLEGTNNYDLSWNSLFLIFFFKFREQKILRRLIDNQTPQNYSQSLVIWPMPENTSTCSIVPLKVVISL